MATQAVPLPVSLEEYLRMDDDDTDGRHWEFHDGEVFAIENTLAHDTINLNLGATLRSLLEERSCVVRVSARVKAANAYCRPDVAVSCDEERVERESLLNPTLIAEVQSPATEDYDRGKKFERYRSIQTFREYLIVAQHKIYIEQHVREDSFWTMREHRDRNGSVILASLGLELSIGEIYAKIDLKPEAPQL